LDEARETAYKVKEVLAKGGDPKSDLPKTERMPTFGEFVNDNFVPYIRIHKRSHLMDECLLRNHLLPMFADLPLDQVRKQHVINLQSNGITNGYAPGTVNRWVILLRYIFNCAIKWELYGLTRNPTKGVDLLDENNQHGRYLTQQEVMRLFAVLDAYPSKQIANVIKLLLYTGARKREILDARWENLDLANRVLKVPISKSGKPRFIVLSDVAVDLLRTIPRRPDVPWIFFNPKSLKPVSSFFAAWNSIRKKAGIPELRVHDLRHSFASFLVISGHSLYEVQKLLGHYDPKVTMRYAHLSQQALTEVTNSVAKFLTQPIDEGIQ
jgi:integrase